MRGRNALWSICLASQAACAGNPAPAGVLPRASEVGNWGFGGWVIAERRNAPAVEGELIAASEDTLWVHDGSGIRVVARDDLAECMVVLFDPRTGSLLLWTALGTLGTVSNGVLLVFTAPMWLITGTVTAGEAAGQAVYRWKRGEPLTALAPYARFPGGIEGVDRSLLQAAPASSPQL